LLLQDLDLKIKYRKGSKNYVADHLSRISLENTDDLIGFSDHFPNEQLFAVSHASLLWYAHTVNYLVTGEIPLHWSKQEKDRFFSQVRHYYWEDPYLFKHCPDQVIHKCIPESEIHSVMTFCHSFVVVVTLEVVGQLLKSYRVGFIGLLYFVILIISVLLVSIINIQVLCPIVI